MKIQQKNKKNESNQVVKKSIKLKIGNIGKILSMLRDGMYSNPIQVLVQEYVSNAIDIHNEIKQSKNIEITLPTEIKPFFRVRDFGTGLSEEEMENIYTQYGVSTKDKDNTQQGGFGLGCKSFWAYSKSFFVKSYYNGVATEYLAHLGESQEGDFDVVSQSPTTEPNGLEVYGSVQRSDMKAFEDAVMRCTLLMKNRPTIKGWANEPSWYKNIKPELTIGDFKIYDKDKVKIVKSQYGATAIVLIDNVIYPLSDDQTSISEVSDFIDGCNSQALVVVPVAIGELEVTPSRDSIRHTKKSVATFKRIFTQAKKDLIIYANKQTKNVKDLKSFLNLGLTTDKYIDIKQYLKFDKDGYSFKLSSNYSNSSFITCDSLFNMDKMIECSVGFTRNGAEKLDKVDIKYISEKNVNSSFFYIGDDSTLIWSRIRHYLERTGEKSVILCRSNVPKDITFWKKEMKAKDVGKLDKPTKSYSSNKIKKGKVCVHYLSINNYSDSMYRNTIHVDLDNEQFTKKHIYFEMDGNSIKTNILGDYTFKDFKNLMTSLNYEICAISKAVVKKIKDSSDFISATEILNNQLKYFIIENSFKNYAMNLLLCNDLFTQLDYLSTLKIEDKQALKSASAYLSLHKKVIKSEKKEPPFLITDLVNKSIKKDIKKILDLINNNKTILDNYPLFLDGLLNEKSKNEYEIYINAKFNS